MGPAVFAIFMRSTVILTAIFALILFPEERWIIRQWKFQVGTLLGVAGAIGVLWFQPDKQIGHISPRGLAVAGTAAIPWALYGVLVKRPSAELGTVRSFAVISFITSAIFLPLTLIFGNIATPLHAGAHVNFILVISALTCISLAHVLYYIAIRELGVALSQSLQLLGPLAALALSAWIFGEHLTHLQMVSAAVLLVGAFHAMQVRPQQTAASAEAL
jgi:drug/metabolite transporter (DMT)-like permease